MLFSLSFKEDLSTALMTRLIRARPRMRSKFSLRLIQVILIPKTLIMK